MKEFHIEGSPNGTVIIGEYVEAETEAEARFTWNKNHPGWQLERVMAVSPGHNHLGQLRPGCVCICDCHGKPVPGVRSDCPDCCLAALWRR